MKLEQQQQAERLFFQSDLNKTQIADTLGITRRTLYNWVRENNWEYLKRAGNAMPSLIAANCYQAMAQLSEHVLSPERTDKPITREEVDSIYKLTLTVNKLKARSILSESMETFTGFLEYMESKYPDIARSLSPLIGTYVSSSAAANLYQLRRDASRIPPASPDDDLREAQLDKEDLKAWQEEKAAAPDPAHSTPSAPAPNPAPTHSSAPAPRPALTSAPSPALTSAPAPTPAVSSAQKPPKFDIRKALRGTATTGPGKAFRKQREANAAA